LNLQTDKKQKDMKKLFSYIIVALFAFQAIGQDHIFSQVISSRIYQNPATTGSSDFISGTLLQRMQWPTDGMTMLSTCLIADYSSNLENSAFSLIASTGYENSINEQITQVGVAYAHTVQISNSTALKAGLRTSLLHKKYGNDFLFGDQYNIDGTISGLETQETFSSNKLFKPDFTVGGLLSVKDNLWIGISIGHLSQPNVSLLENGNSKLPMLIQAQVGKIFHIGDKKNNMSVTPIYNYAKQSTFSQMNIGGYFSKNAILAGAFYKGDPFQAYNDTRQHQAATISLGMKVSQFKAELSYDIDLSSLSGTGGAYELSLHYEFASNDPKKKYKAVSGPKW